MTESPAPALNVRLDAALPGRVRVGGGTAVFVAGAAFAVEAPVQELTLLVDGVEQPLGAHGMPRLDLFASLHPGLDPFAAGGIEVDDESAEDPRLHGYLSGFWGIARIPAGSGPECAIGLRARLVGGRRLDAALARIAVEPEPPPAGAAEPPAPADGPLVAIAMATHEPPPALLARQIETIREQTHRNWVCIISDDGSSDAGIAAVRAAIGDDRRFRLSRSDRNLGFYANFERALSLVPGNAAFVALADQDDVWHPDKLATLLAAIGDAELVYSDARVIDAAGVVRADSYWIRRLNNHEDLLSVLVANSVTGAASLLRADVLGDALPFPPGQFAHFHDHWLALVALARGRIEFVDRPLYDYVQHGDAALGHAAANRMPAWRDRLAGLRRDPRERVRKWRMHYFVDVARLQQQEAILQLRLGARMAGARRRSLRVFADADRSGLALARLWGRGLRELVGRPETLGAEWMLAYAFTWRRLLAASARPRPVRGLRLDAVPPPDLAPAPGREVADHPRVREVAGKLAPLRLAVADDEPPRINVLIPTIDLAHFFGGYIGKFNLALALARRGRRVRIVTVDPVGALPRDWRAQIERFSGLDGVFDQVECAFGRESPGLAVSREDAFVATTWWTAHIARAALAPLGRERFLYLIQEYEPFTFPMGSYAALAAESYTFEHRALFSSELLRGFFRAHGYGVFAGGATAGDRDSVAFENAITAVAPPSESELAARDTRRLLFYARPEPHASRNMFELGVLALGEAARRGALDGWQLRGIGTIGAGASMILGPGARLQMIPRADQGSYAELLRAHDVGLALMHTPHPSLVPIEMASAGMIAVTSRFENKTPEALRAISANLRAPAPTVSSIADALVAAVGDADDVGARARGARVGWSRGWAESFPAELIDRVLDLVDA